MSTWKVYPAPAAAGAAPPKLRQPRKRECYICHNSRADFRQSFSASSKAVDAPNTFQIPSEGPNEEPIEDGMSKIVLVFRLQDFENSVFCLVDAFLLLLHTNEESMFSYNGHTTWTKVSILNEISTYIIFMGPN